MAAFILQFQAMALGVLTFSKKLENFARFCVVYALIGVFVLLDLVSFNIPHFQDIRPCFTLMALFYWSIYRPTLVPAWFAFLLGILLDTMGGLPIGLNAGLFVIAQYMVSGQRKMFMGQPFITVFFGYCFVSAITLFLQWGIYALVSGSRIPVEPILGMGALGIAFFPVALLVMNASHKILPIDFSGMGSQPLDIRLFHGKR